MAKESQLLGTLMPTHPDLFPIVQQMRTKYKLPEISPDDDPITEIFLNGEPVALEDFRRNQSIGRESPRSSTALSRWV